MGKPKSSKGRPKQPVKKTRAGKSRGPKVKRPTPRLRAPDEDFACSNLGPKSVEIPRGHYMSDPFPTEDPSAKAAAIISFLQRLGLDQSPPNGADPDERLCAGRCPEGTCKPVELRTDNDDAVSMELVTHGDYSMYWAIVANAGTGTFRAHCQCV